jgi:hypothetical protein
MGFLAKNYGFIRAYSDFIEILEGLTGDLLYWDFVEHDNLGKVYNFLKNRKSLTSGNISFPSNIS